MSTIETTPMETPTLFGLRASVATEGAYVAVDGEIRTTPTGRHADACSGIPSCDYCWIARSVVRDEMDAREGRMRARLADYDAEIRQAHPASLGIARAEIRRADANRLAYRRRTFGMTHPAHAGEAVLEGHAAWCSDYGHAWGLAVDDMNRAHVMPGCARCGDALAHEIGAFESFGEDDNAAGLHAVRVDGRTVGTVHVSAGGTVTASQGMLSASVGTRPRRFVGVEDAARAVVVMASRQGKPDPWK